MSISRNVRLLCAAFALALLTVTSAAALPDATMASVASTITYQGRLTDGAGSPLTGTYAMAFQLWDDASGGGQVGSDIAVAAVAVEDGLFSVGLDVPADVVDGRALWLRISVDGQWLDGRQALTPTPYALSLRPGAVISGDSAEPVRTLSVVNLGLAPALRVEGSMFGLHALGLTAVKAEGPLGVAGIGLGEAGVGLSGTAEGDGAVGVQGSVTGYTSVGVKAESQFGPGVDATGEVGLKAKGTVGFGVTAEGPIGIEAKGLFGDGISAETAGAHPAAAVRGTSGTDALGGQFSSTDGIGVLAFSDNLVGVSAAAGDVPAMILDGKYGVVASGEDFGINAYGASVGGDFVGETGVRGVAIGDGAESIGVLGQTAGEYGLYTAQKIYAGGGCVGCSTVLLAQNSGTAPLAAGDVVAVVGIAPPLTGQATPRISVRRVVGEDSGMLAVVQSRADVLLTEVPGAAGPEQTATMAIPSEGASPAGPGDNLFVVLQGLARVRVVTAANDIEVGDQLFCSSRTGQVESADQAETYDVPLGFALEELSPGSDLIWVLLAVR